MGGEKKSHPSDPPTTASQQGKGKLPGDADQRILLNGNSKVKGKKKPGEGTSYQLGYLNRSVNKKKKKPLAEWNRLHPWGRGTPSATVKQRGGSPLRKKKLRQDYPIEGASRKLNIISIPSGKYSRRVANLDSTAKEGTTGRVPATLKSKAFMVSIWGTIIVKISLASGKELKGRQPANYSQKGTHS